MIEGFVVRVTLAVTSGVVLGMLAHDLLSFFATWYLMLRVT